MTRTVRAALVQTTWTGDKESMIKAHEDYLVQAAEQGAQVICFQELFYGPYFCQVQDAAVLRVRRVRPGPDRRALPGAGAEHRMVMVLPVYEQEQPGVLYNTAAVIDADGTYLGKYRKHHIPQTTRFLGEVLLPPRQPRLPRLRHRRRQGRGLHLLRPPLPRGLASARPERRGDRVQPLRHQPRAVATTSGSSSSRRPPSPTSTTSARSTGWASRTSATTTSTAPATSSTPRASRSASTPPHTTPSSSSGTSTWTC